MTIDLMAWMERVFESTSLMIIGIVAIISGIWYYLSHLRRGSMTGKTMLVGQPLKLLVILGLLIMSIALVTYLFDIRLP